MLTERVLKFSITLVALAVVYMVYGLGLTGALFYDDYGNLEGLASIESLGDVRQFVFGGIAGPLGRPLALLSFVPHAGGWPTNSDSMLLVNVWLHLLNGLLLGVLGYMLLGFPGVAYLGQRFRIAFCAALLWGVMPLLASSTLIAIQRMTGLSAFFGLLGLLGFVWGYRYQYLKPRLAFILQMGALGGGTLLSMLAKENGALIPVYALLIDVFIASSLRSVSPWLRFVRRGILALGLLSILVYLSPLVQSYFSVSEVRGYSVWDRLQTQVVVLWQYLRAAFAPVPSLYGPFHDYRGADYSGWVSACAFGSWLIVIAVCSWVARRYSRWPIFAVLWFLAGHLIESTSIMLEIYFEHRNYLPLYGFCLAIAVGVANFGERYKKLALAFFMLYVAFQLAVLSSVTSIWGKPALAADIWSRENPASSRAALHAVFQELGRGDAVDTAQLNSQFILRQRYESALETLDRTAVNCETCLGVRVQGIVYSCLLTQEDSVRRRAVEMMDVAASGKDTRVVVDSLFRLREIINEGGCDALQRSDVVDIIRQLALNPLFQVDHILTRLYFIAAALEEDMGDYVGRDGFLRLAEKASPVALPVLQYQIQVAYGRKDFSEARAAVERRYNLVGSSAGAMTKELLNEILEDIEQQRVGSGGGD